MFDEILDFFDRGKRRREADRDQPSRGMFGAFGADDDDDNGDEGRRFQRDGDRRDDSSRERSGRRDSGFDWD